MVCEFEGKTEKEAIAKAVLELGLSRGEFDVEIIEPAKKGKLFKKELVRIRVHFSEESTDIMQEKAATEAQVFSELGNPDAMAADSIDEEAFKSASEAVSGSTFLPPTDAEQSVIDFLSGVVSRMGYNSTITVIRREEKKAVLGISSRYSGILIGRKGRNLDSLQLLANVYANRIGSNARIIVDAENYRERREASLVRLATKTAEQVRRSRNSCLLEPMNPFERRLVHTTLNQASDIETKSEGDGIYKQIRVFYRGG